MTHMVRGVSTNNASSPVPPILQAPIHDSSSILHLPSPPLGVPFRSSRWSLAETCSAPAVSAPASRRSRKTLPAPGHCYNSAATERTRAWSLAARDLQKNKESIVFIFSMKVSGVRCPCQVSDSGTNWFQFGECCISV